MNSRSSRMLRVAAAAATLSFLAGALVDLRTSKTDASTTVPARGPRVVQAKRLRWSGRAREAALRQAVVWRQPSAAPTSAEHGWPSVDPTSVECWFNADRLGGTTPKLECITRTGNVVKVKYGGPEPHGEVAATRLMRAVGFAADDVRFVERVRCYGCPAFPFLTMKVLGLVDATGIYARSVDYDQYRDLAWTAVEQKHPGVEIDTADQRGWAWYELERLQVPRAHVDALRLMAVFLAHWDNKAENQRLACLDDPPPTGDGPCTRPVLIVQDLGATFGPRKVDLRQWQRRPIWTDRSACLVSMSDLPHGGATFPPARLTEAGRRLLAGRLGALTRGEIRAIFEAARFPEHDGERLDAWVAAFEDKVHEISAGPPCPAP